MSNRDKKAWSDFEIKVKQALEAIGYKVSRDHLIAGTQVDLYGELTGDLFIHRQVIECKSSKHATVGVEEVRQLSALVDAISSKSCPITGLMVCQNGFTRTAREFAVKAGISLVTLPELSAMSFDPEPIVNHTIAWFESGELGRSYVHLSCQVKEEPKGTIYKPVERFLDNFFATTKRPGVALLGNFGTGKTSLCKHYAYLLALRWRSSERAEFLPIYINLRDCRSLLNLEADIFETLNSIYSARTTEKGLRQWLGSSSTLLFLDGFDEMAAKMDRVTINENLAALGRFTESRSVKIVLSCRTHFFKTQIEEGTLRGLLRLYMCDWGEEELKDYVRKSIPENVESSLRVIRSTYNLEELAKTPIFLNMITVTLGELGGVVNQAKLYQIYTDRWIQNQDYRSRVSPQQKRQLMEDLAFEMFSSQSSRIAYQQLPVRIREMFDLRDYESIASFDRDIRTCSFLVRDEEGLYYFSHKSFMEFFVGSRLARQIKEGQVGDFSRVELSFEVASFLANYFESDWTQLVRLLMGGSTIPCRANSALALGGLALNPKIREALVFALETDSSLKVQQRAVDALSAFGDPESVYALVRASLRSSDLGVYCLRAIEAFQEDPRVEEVYRSIIEESSDEERVCTVLSSIARQRSSVFRRSVLILIGASWRKGRDEVLAAILTVIDAIADVDFSLSVEKFILAEAMNSSHRVFATQVKEELCKRAMSDIDEAARRNKTKGMSYSANKSRLHHKFSYLLTDSHVVELFSTLYPEVSRRKTRSRPK